jgi:hypothetical protein
MHPSRVAERVGLVQLVDADEAREESPHARTHVAEVNEDGRKYEGLAGFDRLCSTHLARTNYRGDDLLSLQ